MRNPFMDVFRFLTGIPLLLGLIIGATSAQFFPRSSPDYCQLLPDRGPCSESVKRWFYDARTDNCSLFHYGGCSGNQNNFETSSTCEHACRRTRNTGYMWPTSLGFSGSHLIEETGQRRSPMPLETRASANVLISSSHTNDCGQPLQRGFCSSFIPRWHFNGSSCELFYYSGCGGNGNNYLTRESCMEQCAVSAVEPPVRPSSQPTDFAVCFLKPVRGDCRSAILRWFYDADSQKCAEFVYSGCNGNENNYATQQECDQRCPTSMINSRRAFGRANTRQDPFAGNNLLPAADVGVVPDQQADQGFNRPQEDLIPPAGSAGALQPANARCMAEPDRGPCAVDIERWYFDSRTGTCRPFYYGGCLGNSNRFSSKKECESICGSPVERALIPSTTDACLLDPEVGPCRSAFIRFFFDAAVGRCREFTYGGCNGNGNNFLTLDQCDERCRAVRPRLPSGRSNGASGGTGNEIPNPAPVMFPSSSNKPAICTLPKEVGPCRAALRKWFYDGRSCQMFTFGGCAGNENNFDSLQECEGICEKPEAPVSMSSFGRRDHTTITTAPTVIVQDPVCQLPPDSGPCDGSVPRFFYDTASGLCKPFTYGGCAGNQNNFRNVIDCELTCRIGSAAPLNVTKPAPAICQMPAERGSCRAFIPAFFYDTRDDRCKMFYYGGCQGNENRFETRQECESTCQAGRTENLPPSGAGPEMTNEIAPDIRPPQAPVEPRGQMNACELPAEPGNCLALIPSYFFDKDLQMCRQFIYGGCGGNANRFPTAEACQSTCPVTRTPITRAAAAPVVPKNPSCMLPPETGPCRGRFIAYAWNDSQQTCMEFVFGGCNGNSNRFSSREDCMAQCAGGSVPDSGNALRSQPRSAGLTLENISKL